MRVDGSRSALNPGRLRHRVTIEHKVVTGRDSFGADQFEWQTFCTCYMNITAMQGRELEVAQQRWADARYKCESQFIEGVRHEMRINRNGRYLEIMDVQDPFGMRDRLVYYCREWVK